MNSDFIVDQNTGLLTKAHYLPSPNCDERPEDTVIDLLVIHGISLPPGSFGGSAIDDFFCNVLDHESHPSFFQLQNLKVSAHALIRRDGAITQYVPFHKRAWHAGESYFAGRSRCNDFSIGIELEGVDDIPYTLVQYKNLVAMALQLRKIYSSITLDRIVGHSDIAPTRKTDPGPAFDWVYFHKLLEKEVQL